MGIPDLPSLPTSFFKSLSSEDKNSSKLVPVMETLVEKPRVHSVVIHRPYTTKSFPSSHDYLNWVADENAPVKLGLTPWRLRLLKVLKPCFVITLIQLST